MARNNGNGMNSGDSGFRHWFTLGLAISAGAAVTSMVVGGVAYLATKALSQVGAQNVAGSIFGATTPAITDTRRGQIAAAPNYPTNTNYDVNAQQRVI